MTTQRIPRFGAHFTPGLDSEAGSEEVDDLADFCADTAQIFDSERIFRIAQRYIDGLATIHLHLRIRPCRNDPGTEELCAVVGGVGARDDVIDLSYVTDYPGPPSRFPPLEIVRQEVFKLNHRQDASDVEHAMLVRVVQPVQESEGVTIRYLDSKLVGLHALNECPIIRAYAAKHAGRVGAIPIPAFADGELCLPGRLTAAKEHQLPEEILQRGPQVVAKLGNDESDMGIGWWSAQTEDILARIAIEVTDDAAIFIVEKGAPFAVEAGQVLVRPCQPQVAGR
jgi:hypothetical protein